MSNKKEIKLYYSEEELSSIIDGLNNAIIAICNVYDAGKLGVDVPKQFSPLFNGRDFDEIDQIVSKRQEALFKLYRDLISYYKN